MVLQSSMVPWFRRFSGSVGSLAPLFYSSMVPWFTVPWCSLVPWFYSCMVLWFRRFSGSMVLQFHMHGSLVPYMIGSLVSWFFTSICSSTGDSICMIRICMMVLWFHGL